MVEWKKLGEVCEVMNGFAFKSQEYVPKGVRVIRISDVQSGFISDKDKVFYPKDKLTEHERYMLNNGDLVMSLTGNPGRVAFIHGESCALNQRVACLRAKEIKNIFLFYLFNCNEFEKIAFANSTGGAQKNLSTNWLKNYLIPIPSLAEQERIVGILDTFTGSIENLKEQIAQRRKQYEHYRDQLLDLEGKPGVEWKKLGEVGSFFGGLTGKSKEDFVDGNANFITYMNVFSNSSLNPSMVGSVKINEGEKQNKIRKGDILFTGSSETPEETGMSCVVTDELVGDFYMNSFCFGIRPFEPEKFNLHFLKHLLRSESIRKSIAKTASGVTRFNISKARFSKIQIPVPSLAEQERIVGILDIFTTSIENLESQLKEREKQYEYYRNKLLTFE